ncbi:PKD domain-containing protein [Gilvimarinus xylanilyticus]|uniref:PKD domain-containing protein n=1 Tax=Gilvimarinus xylanilyticus TaxID=2944139 RepID=A0A9X2HXV9_9GAMM|nr:PKD domain-containing protein [Gilvimarinus xylanilyticus]MCP8899049.1 PKD domain-containing protein [Gilvimarinus xylanilyticus]
MESNQPSRALRLTHLTLILTLMTACGGGGSGESSPPPTQSSANRKSESSVTSSSIISSIGNSSTYSSLQSSSTALSSQSSKPQSSTPSSAFSSSSVSSIARSSSSTASSSSQSSITVQTLTGQFIDAPVAGLKYRTSSEHTGETNQEGEFTYQAGDVITFVLGALELPQVPAGQIITPMEIMNAGRTSNAVTNLLRLLQSLDDDGFYQSGIEIPNRHLAALESSELTIEDFNLDTEAFAALPEITSIISNIDHLDQLISPHRALQHFENSLINVAGLDSDSDGVPNHRDNDDDNDGTPDNQDLFPLSEGEQSDFDGDFIGDNADPDDDNDGIEDTADSRLQIVSTIQGHTETPADTLFLPQQNRLFISYKNSKKIQVYNLATQKLIKTFALDHLVEDLATTPDGKTLYASLPSSDRSPFEYELTGNIAVIDVASLELQRTFSVPLDPYSLVVSQDNQIAVSSGSGQHADIGFFDGRSGRLLGSARSYGKSKLALHPSEDWLFAADNGLSPSDFEKYDISRDQIKSVGDSPYHGDYRIAGNLWITPDGSRLITRGGDAFFTSDMTYIDSVSQTGETFNHVVFDSEKNIMAAIISEGYQGSSSAFKLYNLDSLQYFEQHTLYGSLLDLAFTEQNMYALTSTESKVDLIKRSHPCTTCATNTRPSATFSHLPQAASTYHSLTFDASNSTDRESPNQLQYRWDIGADDHWETSFSTEPTFDYTFITAGEKFVRLQVKDSAGKTSSQINVINVARAPQESQSLSLATDFKSPGDPQQSLLNPHTGELYIRYVSSLAVVDAKSGKGLYHFNFEENTEDMDLSPNGERLYLHLSDFYSPPRIHNNYSYITVIDTTSKTRINTFASGAVINGMAATNNNQVVVLSEETHYGKLVKFNDNGDIVGELKERFYFTGTARSSRDPDLLYSSRTVLNLRTLSIEENGFAVILNTPLFNIGMNRLVDRDGRVVNAETGQLLANVFTYTNPAHHYGYLTVENAIYNESQDVVTIVERDRVITLSAGPLHTIESNPVSSQYFGLFYYDGKRIALERNYDHLSWAVEDHPCPDCASNLPPTASFSTSLKNDENNSVQVLLDASSSVDPEGAPLTYYWDLDGDQQWDLKTNNNKVEHNYMIDGSYAITMLIADAAGKTSHARDNVEINTSPDSGTPTHSPTPGTLNIGADKVEYSPETQKMYVLDTSEKRLYTIDMASLSLERYHQFTHTPVALDLSSDSKRLVVAIQPIPIDEYYSDPNSGFVAIFDATTGMRTHNVQIDQSPADLAVSTSGELYISGAQDESLTAYALDDTSNIYAATFFDRHFEIFLNNEEDRVFTTEPGSYSNRVSVLRTGENLNRNIETVSHYDAPSFRIGNRIWLHPDNDYFVGSSGVILNTNGEYHNQDLPHGVIDAAFNEDGSELTYIGEDESIYHINTSDWTVLNSASDIAQPRHLVRHNDVYYVLAGPDGATTLEALTF